MIGHVNRVQPYLSPSQNAGRRPPSLLLKGPKQAYNAQDHVIQTPDQNNSQTYLPVAAANSWFNNGHATDNTGSTTWQTSYTQLSSNAHVATEDENKNSLPTKVNGTLTSMSDFRKSVPNVFQTLMTTMQTYEDGSQAFIGNYYQSSEGCKPSTYAYSVNDNPGPVAPNAPIVQAPTRPVHPSTNSSMLVVQPVPGQPVTYSAMQGVQPQSDPYSSQPEYLYQGEEYSVQADSSQGTMMYAPVQAMSSWSQTAHPQNCETLPASHTLAWNVSGNDHESNIYSTSTSPTEAVESTSIEINQATLEKVLASVENDVCAVDESFIAHILNPDLNCMVEEQVTTCEEVAPVAASPKPQNPPEIITYDQMLRESECTGTQMYPVPNVQIEFVDETTNRSYSIKGLTPNSLQPIAK